MALKSYTDEQKDYLLATYLKAGTINRTLEIFYEVFPDVHKYDFSTVYKYIISESGKQDLDRVNIVEETKALEEGLSQKANRIAIVADIGMKIYARLLRLGPEDRSFVPLSRELRECIKDIRVEMEGEGHTSLDAQAAAMNFFTHITGEGSPEWLKKAVGVPEVSTTFPLNS
jgi:hypothetical protein